MAKIRSNPILQGLSGGMGSQLMFRRLRDGRTILCVKPDFSNRKLSQEQKAHHQRFREAAAYALQAAKEKPIYAELAAGTMKTAYNIALSDWFHPPVIHEVSWQAGNVRIRASDDVLVRQVRVTILDEQGQALEQGEALQAKGSSAGSGWWAYNLGSRPAGRCRVVAEAQDLAGNVTRKELVLE